MSFDLHPDLKRDGIELGQFDLCKVLLINDAAYPWFVLVPKLSGMADLCDLPEGPYEDYCRESLVFSKAIMRAFDGEKLNVAALGNMTPQLHIHHIVRYAADAAWPGPIWGKQPMTAYTEDHIAEVKSRLAAQNMPGFIPA